MTETETHIVEPQEHQRVITCSCGETFKTEESFERHKNARLCRRFNKLAQKWFDEYVGGALAEHHRECSQGMGGIGAFHGAEINPDIDHVEPDEKDIRKACIEYMRGSLTEPNVNTLFSLETDDEQPERPLSKSEEKHDRQ